MSAGPARGSSWAEVLAAVEADLVRTESMLAGPPAGADPASRYVAPAQWQLPGPPPDLPPLEQMPAVPEELRERIHDLRVRIVALQVELAAELAGLRSAHGGSLAQAAARRPAPAVAVAARYVDTRL